MQNFSRLMQGVDLNCVRYCVTNST